MTGKGRKIRVLIVDDSAFIRRTLKIMIESDPELEVIDIAHDGREAIYKIEQLNPDVVTMDIEMPVMNGLDALRIIMSRHPVPVLMVSSLTEEGARSTLDALEAGAVDFIPKHLNDLSFNIIKIKSDLIEKIKAASGSRPARAASPPPVIHPPIENVKEPLTDTAAAPTKKKARGDGFKADIIAIGASTGGPRAVQEILTRLPGDLDAPVLVVQHMPKNFTGPYAERLNNVCKMRVKEASEGDILKPGNAYIAPGGTQMRLKRYGQSSIRLTMDDNPADAIYKPCIDIALYSVAELYKGNSLAIILTGMGADGKAGTGMIKHSGGKVIAEDESSCVVYGMPKAVVEAGFADKVVPKDLIAQEIVDSAWTS